MTPTSPGERRLAEAVERDGYVIVSGAVSNELLAALHAAIDGIPGAPGVYERDRVYAARDLFRHVPAAAEVLQEPAVRDMVTSVLGPDAFCVRGIFLDKAPRASWKVPWHQDATVTVKERADVVGFGPWSTKAGVTHVIAPPGLLSAMLTLRLYLDDCSERGGALKLLPASHQYGRLPHDSIEQFTRGGEATHNLSAGDVLLMRPLTLHASSAASEPGSRRVIQLEFAARSLPQPLEWYEARELR